MNKKLIGVFIPTVTPFTNQKLDLGKLSHNIEISNSTKVAGYMPLGSNGEFAHMNDEEQLSVFKTVKKKAAADKVLMVGIARQSAYSTIEFGKKVQDLGVDFVSILCPSYFASFMSDATLIKYYTTIADALEVPILLYNCPKFAAGVTISTDVVKELSPHANIAGMKDTSSGNIEMYLSVKHKSFDVIAGSVTNFIQGLKNGASGGVLSMANYLPAPCCEIHELFLSGRVDEAEALSEKIITLNKGAAGKFGVAGVKASCEMFGYQGGEVRNPLFDCLPSQIEAIKQSFLEAGYLPDKEY